MQFDDNTLMAFIELENKGMFVDKRNRNFDNVVKLLKSSLCSNQLYVRKSLKDLIKLGLLTRVTDIDISLRTDNLASLIYFTKENKKRFKELYDKQEIILYHNKEFVLVSIE